MRKLRRSRLVKMIKSFNNDVQRKLKRLERLKMLESVEKGVYSARKRLRRSNASRTSKS
jgi:hypothetical protein